MCVWCVCVCVCGGEGTSGAQNAAWSGASTQSTVIISISIIGITITSQSASSPRAGHAGAMRRLTSAPPPNDDPPGGDQKNPSLMPKQLPRVCCVCCACVCVCARGGGGVAGDEPPPSTRLFCLKLPDSFKRGGREGKKNVQAKRKKQGSREGKGGPPPLGLLAAHTPVATRERGGEGRQAAWPGAATGGRFIRVLSVLCVCVF